MELGRSKSIREGGEMTERGKKKTRIAGLRKVNDQHQQKAIAFWGCGGGGKGGGGK